MAQQAAAQFVTHGHELFPVIGGNVFFFLMLEAHRSYSKPGLKVKPR